MICGVCGVLLRNGLVCFVCVCENLPPPTHQLHTHSPTYTQSAVALLSRAYAEWFLETADKGRVSWPAVQGFRYV